MNTTTSTVVALIAAALLQVAVAPHIAIFGVVPNLLMLVVVTLALIEGPVGGAVAGFAAGLLFDVLGSAAIGPAALVLSVVGYVAGMLQENLFAESWIVPATVVFIATLVGEASYALLLGALGADVAVGEALLRIAVPGAAYSTVLAVLAFLQQSDRP